MDYRDFGSSLFAGAGEAAASLLDTVTNAIAGEADALRDGTEFDSVVLPRDLAAHRDVQTEWWYYTGHLVTASGRSFGFELVFFKRRTDLDRFSVVPLRLLGNPYYFAHFALTDKDQGKFMYAHRKSANGSLDLPASASESHFYLMLGDWSAREAAGDHFLRASIDHNLIFEASLRPVKPTVLIGDGGVSYKDHEQASRYFAFPRMAIEGDLVIDGRAEHFKGTAWMDREFGTWEPTEKQKGWDWFSIQLDDEIEIMVYQIRDSAGEPTEFSRGYVCRSDGSVVHLPHEGFELTVLDRWKSPRSNAEYPSGWKLAVPELAIDLNIVPVAQDQELDTRGTTMILYWEGACRVTGNSQGDRVSGDAYVELVGYDRSHESPDLSRFLLGNFLNGLRY
ncbi:MAG TPA: lipocalin family protein [Pyrinomonadaceae bacterium]|nr:lipocalin family protein [Pyrinomonadaceae bacterium]